MAFGSSPKGQSTETVNVKQSEEPDSPEVDHRNTELSQMEPWVCLKIRALP